MAKPNAAIAVIIAKIILPFMVYWFLIVVVKVLINFDKSKNILNIKNAGVGI